MTVLRKLEKDDSAAVEMPLRSLELQQTYLPILQPYFQGDRGAVMDLLRDLSISYPGGVEWLKKRLIDVENGLAFCTVVKVRSSIVGIAIETPKKKRTIKLSTLFVAKEFRKTGIGSVLMEALKEKWIREGVVRVFGTYNITRMPSLGYFLHIHGFKQICIQKNRYRVGYDEAIVEWNT